MIGLCGGWLLNNKIDRQQVQNTMMKCPKCEGEISCVFSIRTEDAQMPIETSYQWWECRSCGQKYFARSEDSHVNMFDDRIEHQGYFADPIAWAETMAWAKQCPDSGNTACTCKVHQEVPPAGFSGGSAWYRYD